MGKTLKTVDGYSVDDGHYKSPFFTTMMFYFSFIKITETQDRNEGIWAKIKKQYYPFKQMDTLNLYIATFYELRDNARLEPLRAICIINQASPQANPNNSKGVMEAYAIGFETEVTIWADK